MSEPALALRLVHAPEPRAEPAGLALAPQAARDLLDRIGNRLQPYARLRLALGPDIALLFASEPVALPWHEAARWLAWDGVLLVPCGWHLDVPARWRGEVTRRFLERHGLAGPAALLPEGAAGRQRLLDLAGSRALTDLDARGLADGLAKLAEPCRSDS